MAHIAFPSLSNWNSDLDITDKEIVKTVNETHNMVKDILVELTE